MESVASTTPLSFQFRQSTILAVISPSFLPLPYLRRRIRIKGGVCFARKTGSDSGGFDLLQKPVVSDSNAGGNAKSGKKYDAVFESGEDEEERSHGGDGKEREWIDWEDQILEVTVPLVGFARMILHSKSYACGERLLPQHQKAIVERFLAYHPDCENKIGCGIDYITIDNHPKFKYSRCLFIVRKDGEKEDFSYWKCIKGLIRKNYPLYAETFIQRHFQRWSRGD